MRALGFGVTVPARARRASRVALILCVYIVGRSSEELSDGADL